MSGVPLVTLFVLIVPLLFVSGAVVNSTSELVLYFMTRDVVWVMIFVEELPSLKSTIKNILYYLLNCLKTKIKPEMLYF